jgi:flagellar motor switch protein FliN/FliY
MDLSQSSIDVSFAEQSDAAAPAAPSEPGNRGGGRQPVARAASRNEGAQPLPQSPTKHIAKPDMHRILGMEVPVSSVLAEQEMSVHEILKITVGTIIEFEKPSDEELHLYVANRRIGSGFAVKVGENFGLRISRIEPVKDRIDALGPGT